MVKTVCIIGAGPSGLVAAKTLTSSSPLGTFHVTILDANTRIGGLWPLDKTDSGLVNPDMCTNQSRHTVCFSDLAWESDAPRFPKAWMVGRYLERYMSMYGKEWTVKLGWKVVRAEKRNEGWMVKAKNGAGEEDEMSFDYLIVSTGYFGKPKMPDGLVAAGVPVMHSSSVRSLNDVLTNGGSRPVGKGRKIVVVGGQMSGVEVAAAIAMQISSAANTPGGEGVEEAGKYEVVHVAKKPVWVMPLLFPVDPVVEREGEDGVVVKEKNRSPNFLPLDMVSYNISKRPEGPLKNTGGHITPEAAGFTHAFAETYIGCDQSEFGPALGVVGEHRTQPPMLACSDHYLEFVRHKKISVITGRMADASGSTVNITTSSGDIQMIEDVAAIICATGFDASPSLSFLPEEYLEQLDHDPSQDSFPLALNVHTTISRKLPTLGFVGFYRSPYWGVMEMQARFLAKLWGGDEKAQQELEEDTTMERMMKLRRDERAAQFPMGDYTFLMEDFAEILGITRQERTPSLRTGLIAPYRYTYSNASAPQAEQTELALTDHKSLFSPLNTAKFLPRATFRGLLGIWTLTRTITSRISTFPSGQLIGTATLSPRTPTAKKVEGEYLYFEEGTFRASSGMGEMRARRAYVYRLMTEREARGGKEEGKGGLELWFAKGDYVTADYFFHQVEFLSPKEEKNAGEPWRAKAGHLCIDDMYNVTYAFSFSGAMLETWTCEYTVKGPQKDYTIRNVYTRPNM